MQPCGRRPVRYSGIRGRHARVSKLSRVALAVGLALLVLFAGEWIAGHLDPQAPFRRLHAPRPGSPWLYDLVPGATARSAVGDIEYNIGTHGFRDHDRAREKPPGVFRVAILGDSVAFGYGVSRADGFVGRLETELREVAAETPGVDRVEVLNFAVSGFNPYNEAELFRGVVRDFEPDLTLVQFCVNDLNDPRHHFGASTVQRLGELPALAFPDAASARDVPWKVSPAAAACDRSNLCRLLLGGALGPARTPEGDDEFQAAFEIRAGPEFRAEWAWLRSRYADIAAAAHDVDSAFGVLAFPNATDVGADPGAADAGATLRGIGDEEGWTVIDLVPAFRATGEQAQTLFLDLWHPTRRGHEVAASAIANEIRRRGLVRRPD